MTVANVCGSIFLADILDIAFGVCLLPNPAFERVHIQSSTQVNVMITDMEGRSVREIRNDNNIYLKGLAEGIYLLHIKDENGALIKVVKEVKLRR